MKQLIYVLLLSSFFSFSFCSERAKKDKKSKKDNKEEKAVRRSQERVLVTSRSAASEEYSTKTAQYYDNGSFRVKSIDPIKKEKGGRIEHGNEKKKHTKRGTALHHYDSLVQTHFNVLGHVSEPSSVNDERPVLNPFLTDRDPKINDSLASTRTKALSQLPKVLKTKGKPLPDCIGSQVEPAVLQTDYDGSYDGGMSVGNTNYHPVYGKVVPPFEHPIVAAFEADPMADTYIDPETSQKQLLSHIGRPIGRDGREKPLEKRDSYSSVNDGCIIC